MNVTVKLQDSLYKEARHKAVDQGLSLSGWLAFLIRREIEAVESPASDNILDCIGDERLAEVDFASPPLSGNPSEVEW